MENVLPPGLELALDAVAFAVGADGKIVTDSHFVFFGSELRNNRQSISSDNAIVLDDSGDDISCQDDARISVNISLLHPAIMKLNFCIIIYKFQPYFGGSFSMVSDLYVRIVDKESGEEILRYDLSENFVNEDALVLCSLNRGHEGWEFVAIGAGSRGGAQALVDAYT